MKFSKTVLVIPAASLVFGFAAAVGAGACGDNDDVTIPTSSTPPPGTEFVGGEFGGACNGNVYATAGTGWAFCDDDKWEYTTDDPSTDNFTEYTPDGDAGPQTDGSSVADGAQGDDATRIDETGPGDDGGQQGQGDHDGGQTHGGDDGGQQ